MRVGKKHLTHDLSVTCYYVFLDGITVPNLEEYEFISNGDFFERLFTPLDNVIFFRDGALLADYWGDEMFVTIWSESFPFAYLTTPDEIDMCEVVSLLPNIRVGLDEYHIYTSDTMRMPLELFRLGGSISRSNKNIVITHHNSSDAMELKLSL